MSPSRSLTISCLCFHATSDGTFLNQVRIALARVLPNERVRRVAQVQHSCWSVAGMAQRILDGEFEVRRRVR